MRLRPRTLVFHFPGITRIAINRCNKAVRDENALDGEEKQESHIAFAWNDPSLPISVINSSASRFVFLLNIYPCFAATLRVDNPYLLVSNICLCCYIYHFSHVFFFHLESGALSHFFNLLFFYLLKKIPRVIKNKIYV